MTQFIHEILVDPVNGDREVVVCNGVEIGIKQFMLMEPDYKALPADIKGFNYVPGKHYYAYNLKGDVVDPILSEEVLNACIDKTDDYVEALRKIELSENPEEKP